MRLLLDTHILIWAISSTETLKEKGRALIADMNNEVVISAVSIWEIAIKNAGGRGRLPPMAAARVLDLARRAGYSVLPVTPAHAIAVEALPLIHGDPFDRLLVAQALTEPLILLTRDRHVAAYSDQFILV